MASEREDRDQLELWPIQRESRRSSDSTRERAPRQRPGLRGPQPAQPSKKAVPATPTNDGERLWSIAEVAHYLGVSKDTIYGWPKSGYGPPAIKVGKHLRWRPADVTDWIDWLRQTEASGAE